MRIATARIARARMTKPTDKTHDIYFLFHENVAGTLLDFSLDENIALTLFDFSLGIIGIPARNI